jgi:hypothetical protein
MCTTVEIPNALLCLVPNWRFTSRAVAHEARDAVVAHKGHRQSTHDEPIARLAVWPSFDCFSQSYDRLGKGEVRRDPPMHTQLVVSVFERAVYVVLHDRVRIGR